MNKKEIEGLLAPFIQYRSIRSILTEVEIGCPDDPNTKIAEVHIYGTPLDPESYVVRTFICDTDYAVSHDTDRYHTFFGTLRDWVVHYLPDPKAYNLQSPY